MASGDLGLAHRVGSVGSASTPSLVSRDPHEMPVADPRIGWTTKSVVRTRGVHRMRLSTRDFGLSRDEVAQAVVVQARMLGPFTSAWGVIR